MSRTLLRAAQCAQIVSADRPTVAVRNYLIALPGLCTAPGMYHLLVDTYLLEWISGISVFLSLSVFLRVLIYAHTHTRARANTMSK